MNQQLTRLQQQINAELSETFEHVKASLNLQESRLLSAMEYALLNGGKRMRPLLLSLVGQVFEANQQDIKVASLALECIHAYSLIHDDLPSMDNDDLRRGKPTCHIQFDEATAILAGDALQTLAFECLSSFTMEASETKRLQLVAILAKASGLRGMCLGQSLDLLATNTAIDLASLQQLHQLKTGALLKASVQMGACLGTKPYSPKTENLLVQFADNIGLAFQIQDDILDVISDTETLGKPQGSDQQSNKSTFVTHFGLEGAKNELQKKYHLAIQSLEQLEYNTQDLQAFTQYMVTRTY
ncbi:farnesyl diphosphate synthase [Glaciecola sp. 1036]|uniref:farnesyl diphosphate synthase n=1 Tax=Alteromonadaceae TaxID=72275 RepID=UPI003D065471